MKTFIDENGVTATITPTDGDAIRLNLQIPIPLDVLLATVHLPTAALPKATPGSVHIAVITWPLGSRPPAVIAAASRDTAHMQAVSRLRALAEDGSIDDEAGYRAFLINHPHTPSDPGQAKAWLDAYDLAVWSPKVAIDEIPLTT
ncbi:hypothetical protein SAMN05421505_12043 [Sinosporangium album]|uniref:Uncharacterized protein n=1 Tax=Sinosporangium album TaxID=504805 RepID=A0A1G8ECU6_9ACTN|nr:hypothetical protein [Sinosporangium album]SDH67716.1 hypothetical protein SAMN05421505_12043 [Sinosporangium album]